MEWYFYLNYFIYRFYKRKKDNMPELFSFGGTITLFVFNLLTVWMIYDFVTNFWAIPEPIPHGKVWVMVGYAFLALINYLILYRNKKYIDIFDDFRKESNKYKKWDTSVKLYIILSIVCMLIVFFTAGFRNEYVREHLI